jgi:hypothetical protein
MAQDFEELTSYAKSFSGLTPELEKTLNEIGNGIRPKLAIVTDDFYQKLSCIPKAVTFIDGRTDTLKAAHLEWLHRLFSGPYDEVYVENLYKIGYVHVKVNLPVEFMAGAMTLINNSLFGLLVNAYGSDQAHLAKALEAVNAVTGMSLFVMQQSYQEASIAAELEKFLRISGMSRTLFTNLALAYRDK